MIHVALVALRLALGLMFLSSFFGKVLNIREFLTGMADYEVLPPAVARTYGLLLVPAEGFVAFSMLTGLVLGAGTLLCLALLLSFLIAVSINVRRGRDLPCYCTGVASSERVSPRSLARIGLLLTGALAVQSGLIFAAKPAAFVASGFQRAPGAAIVVILEGTLALFTIAVGGWLLALPSLLRIRAWRPTR
ncbi:MAG TPA: MauE/DoxX family redox-associated membrane protein [Thermomicrobiaceae bacterium]|nr:MauE/DoxX family redox-associated membrane protein [Thermomicrobiaceae bacterium]